MLPAKSESAVVDSHDEHDLSPQGGNLMMRKSMSNVPDLFDDGDCRYIHDGGADLMARQLSLFVYHGKESSRWSEGLVYLFLQLDSVL